MLRSETAGIPDARAAALRGLAAYQQAPRPPAPVPMPPRFFEGRVCLRDYGGVGPPVVFVPSLINPPGILDLGERSLLRWMASQGLHVWLVDWGTPGPADRTLGLADHVERLLIPLIQRLEQPPVLVGYCLGGTLAIAAAARTPVAGLATLAAPWRFAGYGDARASMLEMWQGAQPWCERLGLVPMEILQAGFWQLDPAATVAKYGAFGRLDPGSAAASDFVRLEDWANTGAPLTYGVGHDLFGAFVGADLPGNEQWHVAGQEVSLSRLSMPTLEFVSTTDRIVPPATAARFKLRHELPLGHVGMIVGGAAPARLWSPLAEWVRRTANAALA
ncbi:MULTISPECIES: alpha/beta fold hydrolase [unclassified Sphingomonas]|uniref:alpha/beta fold hydrolase n=1 Tax=unclassified Sphingomonas TaxID=196159 RepID=UPI002269B494|nr:MULTISPECIES: alpha/beta fold hydrolase [unclassified Sphingomonas]